MFVVAPEKWNRRICARQKAWRDYRIVADDHTRAGHRLPDRSGDILRNRNDQVRGGVVPQAAQATGDLPQPLPRRKKTVSPLAVVLWYPVVLRPSNVSIRPSYQRYGGRPSRKT